MEISVNGKVHKITSSGDTPLAYVLRNEIGLTGTKIGCGAGHCGACMVHLNGNAVNSCDIPVSMSTEVDIVTIEGVAELSVHAQRIQKYFAKECAFQCGYCIPGIIMTLCALLKREPTFTVSQITQQLSERNLCRCGSHYRIVKAISGYLTDGK